MTNYKILIKNNFEKILIVTILLSMIIVAIICKDTPIALISALCGTMYTYLAGKGVPSCYLFGITGSCFYSYLSYQNSVWGHLALYALYFLPMQILGYFRWNKNLQDNKKEIVKIYLPRKELYLVLIFSLLLIIISYIVLKHFNDPHPLLDSITSILCLGGMYSTVRRAIEQWFFWMVVNSLSFIMWLNVVLTGTQVYSTALMWGVYTFFAFYFYIIWYKELKNTKS